MSASTSIEWTDRSWNPVTGCDKVSPGCKHCYAEVIAERFWATQYPPVVGPESGVVFPRRFTDVQTHENRLLEPLSWRRPARIFVNSMSDLFHEDVAFPFIAAVFAVMAATPRHTYQVLTKRAERMREFFEWVNHANGTEVVGSGPLGDGPPVHMRRMRRVDEDIALRFRQNTEDGWCLDACLHNSDVWPLPNVWLGVSCENQQYADERIPLLLETAAAVRFVSAEPLLGPVNLRGVRDPVRRTTTGSYLSQTLCADGDGGLYERPALDWVIIGGESGPGARPCDLAWVRSIVQQCQAADARCFVKQIGTNPHERVSRDVAVSEPLIPHVRLRDRKGGDLTEWPADLQVREWPRVGVTA